MPHELIKEKIILNEQKIKDKMQILIEGDIIVPDIKPDMAIVLKTDADVVIEKSDLSMDRLSFSGKLFIKALYLAKGEGKTVHSMNAQHVIDDFMNLDGVNREMKCQTKAVVSNIDFKILNDRKLSYKAVVEVCVEVETKKEHEVIKTISDLPDNQIKKIGLTLNSTIDQKQDRFVIKEELNLPQGKPNIRELLQSTVNITNKDIKLGTGRANVSGEIVVNLLYKGDDDDSYLEFHEAEIPFNGSIDLPFAKDTHMGDIDLTVDGQYVQVKPNSDGEDRAIEVEISIVADVKITTQNEVDLLADAFIVNKKLDFNREDVNYPTMVCRNKNQCSVKEVVTLPDKSPDMLQVFKVSGKVVIDSAKAMDDKVVVDGIIETDILYIAKNDDTPIYNHSTILPYKQIVETKGCTPDMEVLVDKNLDHIGFNMLSDREVELRFLVSFNTKVSSYNQTTLIKDLCITDIDNTVLDEMPSIIIYIIQKGDTLWDIAKCYNVSLDELVELNDIENRDLIFPGQKLLILKKTS